MPSFFCKPAFPGSAPLCTRGPQPSREDESHRPRVLPVDPRPACVSHAPLLVLTATPPLLSRVHSHGPCAGHRAGQQADLEEELVV